MQCVVHANQEAIGTCTSCGNPVCSRCKPHKHDPRLHCQECLRTQPVQGFEIKSRWHILGWPLVHIAFGTNSVTLAPATAKGLLAIGRRAVGVFAIGRRAAGVFSIGEVSAGIFFSAGGLSASTGISVGGICIGATAIGGVALGLVYAFGGFAVAEQMITPMVCSQEAYFLVRDLLGDITLPQSCSKYIYPSQ